MHVSKVVGVAVASLVNVKSEPERAQVASQDTTRTVPRRAMQQHHDPCKHTRDREETGTYMADRYPPSLSRLGGEHFVRYSGGAKRDFA